MAETHEIFRLIVATLDVIVNRDASLRRYDVTNSGVRNGHTT